MKTKLFAAVAIAACLSACSETEQQPKKEAKASALQPGEYEVTAEVEGIRSTDGTTPASALKKGAPAKTVRACVAAENKIADAAFLESSEKCTPAQSYARKGRLTLQLQCNRSGNGGLSHNVDGTFTADSFEARVTTTTYFAGNGDYESVRKVNAKRVGDCPAKAG